MDHSWSGCSLASCIAALLSSRLPPVTSSLSTPASLALHSTADRSAGCLAVPLYSPLYMVSVRLAPMSMNLMAARALHTVLTEARALL